MNAFAHIWFGAGVALLGFVLMMLSVLRKLNRIEKVQSDQLMLVQEIRALIKELREAAL